MSQDIVHTKKLIKSLTSLGHAVFRQSHEKEGKEKMSHKYFENDRLSFFFSGPPCIKT